MVLNTELITIKHHKALWYLMVLFLSCNSIPIGTHHFALMTVKYSKIHYRTAWCHWFCSHTNSDFQLNIFVNVAAITNQLVSPVIPGCDVHIHSPLLRFLSCFLSCNRLLLPVPLLFYRFLWSRCVSWGCNSSWHATWEKPADRPAARSFPALGENRETGCSRWSCVQCAHRQGDGGEGGVQHAARVQRDWSPWWHPVVQL